jgi:hypothetical protein
MNQFALSKKGNSDQREEITFIVANGSKNNSEGKSERLALSMASLASLR